jgi:transcriptional regulator with XRE-family HTH domain
MNTPALLATPSERCRTLGDRLRMHRLAQALSQQELALRSGVSQGALKKLEKDGQSNLLTVVRVVQALGLADELGHVFLLGSPASIADMERAEKAQRRRAPPRRRA